MSEVPAGIVGGLGLFLAATWSLSESLKAMASRKLRRSVSRWAGNRYSALLWGCFAGSITQNQTALTFIVVNVLRAGMVPMPRALALILGGCIGSSTLVLVVTFDVKVLALYVLGVSGVVMASERLSRFRTLAASFFSGGLLVLGLVVLQDAAAPLAERAWFLAMLDRIGHSMELAFVISAILTFVLQSPNAICIFAIGLLSAGALSVDEALMIIYGTTTGSALLLYLLSSSLSGRSRQVAMYMVAYDLMVAVVFVPLLYLEVYFGIPLVKAMLLSFPFDPEQRLAVFYILTSVFGLPLMIATVNWCTSALERFWPSSQSDALSRARFIHDHAAADVDTALPLVRLEHRQVVRNLSLYFAAAREGQSLGPLREASCSLLGDIGEFLDELQALRPAQAAEERNTIRNHHKLLVWLEEALGTLCARLARRPLPPPIEHLQGVVLEGVDGVLIALVDVLESDEPSDWEMMSRVGDEGAEIMRKIRGRYLDTDPAVRDDALGEMLLLTNATEEALLVLSRLIREFGPPASNV